MLDSGPVAVDTGVHAPAAVASGTLISIRAVAACWTRGYREISAELWVTCMRCGRWLPYSAASSETSGVYVPTPSRSSKPLSRPDLAKAAASFGMSGRSFWPKSLNKLPAGGFPDLRDPKANVLGDVRENGMFRLHTVTWNMHGKVRCGGTLRFLACGAGDPAR